MTQDLFYPYVLEPRLAPAIWGGDSLVRRLGKLGDPRVAIGESWECWDTNRVRNGSLAGRTIADLRSSLGAALLGGDDATRIFPILTKFIDARDWLSVQVHPDDAYAQRVERQPFGKTECWHILSAAPGAELVLGWTRETSPEEYRRRVRDGTLGELLRRIPVHAGDTFYLPAGTLHAIGAGILLYEVQQASDLTYRIFDWNRVGSDGKPRPLHVEKAADVLDYGPARRGTVETVPYTLDGTRRMALVADARFVLERIAVTSEPATLPTGEMPLIITTLATAVELHCDGGGVLLPPYTTALIPAAARFVQVTASDREGELLVVSRPRTQADIGARLLAAGVPQDRVDRFKEQFTS